MAVKKTVATLQKGAGKGYAKVIKVGKSEKTGAYIFKEEVIPNENVTEYFKKYIPSGKGDVAGNGVNPKMIEL